MPAQRQRDGLADRAHETLKHSTCVASPVGQALHDTVLYCNAEDMIRGPKTRLQLGRRGYGVPPPVPGPDRRYLFHC